MAAAVETRVFVGSSPGAGAVAATIRLKNADNNTIDANDPTVKPASGVNYSWWKTVAFHATSAPDTSITNVKLYTDGSLGWAGQTVYVGDQFTETYVQATGTTSSGDEMVANHSQISARTSLFTFTSGSPVTVTISPAWAESTGRITGYVVLQSELATSAAGGTQVAETATWQFDEI